MYFGTNAVSENQRYGDAGQQEKVVNRTGIQRNAWSNQIKGVRFAVLFMESSRIF